MLILNEQAVRAAFPMANAIEAMREVMLAHAQGHAYQPLRMVVQPPGVPGLGVIKPAATGTGTDVAMGLKVVTLFADNPQTHGLPAILGFVALQDPDTGAPVAILDGAVVTEIRTGAASAVATDLLANPGAGDLALFGAGVQARAHLAAMAEVRDLRRVRVWSRTRSSSERLAAWAAGAGFPTVEVCDAPADAAAGADLVCTVTTASEPVLDGDWVAPGCHVNAVGAFQPATRELATNLVTRAGAIVVDSRESASAEAGDLLLPIAEGAMARTDWPELGELLLGKGGGRTSDDEITIYESLGLAIQDVAAAARITSRAHELGLGVDVDF